MLGRGRSECHGVTRGGEDAHGGGVHGAVGIVDSEEESEGVADAGVLCGLVGHAFMSFAMGLDGCSIVGVDA